MIWRITDRATFTRLRRDGRRLGRGPITVWFVPDEGASPPRLACAVSRKVGGAVVRNRLRRRLRAAFEELARDPGVVPGAYLVSLAPAVVEMSYEEMKAHVASTLRGFEHQGERT